MNLESEILLNQREYSPIVATVGAGVLLTLCSYRYAYISQHCRTCPFAAASYSLLTSLPLDLCVSSVRVVRPTSRRPVCVFIDTVDIATFVPL
jgi:hypothetical protein